MDEERKPSTPKPIDTLMTPIAKKMFEQGRYRTMINQIVDASKENDDLKNLSAEDGALFRFLVGAEIAYVKNGTEAKDDIALRAYFSQGIARFSDSGKRSILSEIARSSVYDYLGLPPLPLASEEAV